VIHESARKGIHVTAKIRFTRQYKPVGFGDPPDPRTVDGKRLSAAQAAETHRLNRIRKDEEKETRHQGSWLVRLSDFFAWGMTHMKFRTWKGGKRA
jgi:hypothetical protein